MCEKAKWSRGQDGIAMCQIALIIMRKVMHSLKMAEGEKNDNLSRCLVPKKQPEMAQ